MTNKKASAEAAEPDVRFYEAASAESYQKAPLFRCGNGAFDMRRFLQPNSG